MTSYQDHQAFIPTSPKFPPISAENSGILNASSFSKRQASSQWNAALRNKLDHSIAFSGQPHMEDVDELITEIIKIMIAALQPNSSKQTWLDLNHILSVIQPYQCYVASASISHYVERVFLHYVSNMDRLFDVPILDSLNSIFPRDISRAKSKYGVTPEQCSAALFYKSKLSNSIEYSNNQAIERVLPTKQAIEQSLPDGNNPYALMRPGHEPETYFKAKPLTMKTFSQNIGNVAMESAAKESTWKDSNSSTVAAISVDLLQSFKTPDVHVSEPAFIPTPKVNITPHELVKKAEDFAPMDGREAVELFLQHKHLHKVKFIYLNKAKSRHYSPYNLISVPRDHVDKEHFIFSSFGVLHIFPNGTDSETLTLAEWNNNAVLWKAVHTIPFFQNYLPIKCFTRWKSNVNHIRYMRLRRKISNSLLHAVPNFGSALLHIFRLIHELTEINMLPDKPNQVCQYSLSEFEADAHKLKVDAEGVLELFFEYCKTVVDTTKQACFDNLKYAEHQAKHTHPLYSKESLYIQRRKREARARNLEKAKQITQQVPSFIALADQAISVHLVSVCRAAITRFVESVLCMSDSADTEHDETSSVAAESHATEKGTTSSKDAEVLGTVFATKFVFNKDTYCIEMNPSTIRFKSVMSSAINTIFNLVCHEAHSMSTHSNISLRSKRPGSAPASIGSFSNDGSSGRSTASSFSVDLDSEAEDVKPDLGIKKVESSKETTKLLYMDDRKASGLTEPNVSTQLPPSKSEDKDGVVTPDLLLSSGQGARLGLSVDGQRLMGDFNPLDHTKLKEKIMNDPEIAAATLKQSSLVDGALREVEDFCEEQSWISDIKRFTSNWNEHELDLLKKKPARQIEELLNQIKDWIEKVKNMDRSLVTSNRLIYVDCRLPYSTLVPALNNIFKKIIHMAMAEAKTLSESVTSNAKDSLKVLSNKDTNLKSFATYARKVTDSIKSKNNISNKVTHIRALYEVVRMTYRQLTQEEEKLDDRVKTTWEAFLFQLKDATNFVSNQQPVITKQMNEIFNAYKEQAEKYACSAFEGIAVNPKMSPSKVIAHLDQCISDFLDTQAKMQELSRYHESICGSPYDLSPLNTWSENLNNRLSLWKSIDIYKSTVAEWGVTNFRKFNCHTSMDKIREWQDVATSLQSSLPPDDPVLLMWQQNISTLSQELPLLSKLSSDAMKLRHWREVFTGMGEAFMPGSSFLVDDIIAYKPSQHAELINKVYNRASAEYLLDQLLHKVRQQWEKRQFQLAKHIYVINHAQAFDEESSSTRKKESASVRSKDRKLMFKEPTAAREIDSGTYTLVGVEEIFRDLSDSHVTLQGMLQSKHATEIQKDAEIWSDTLQQIGEIVQLWVSCQDKWMYLNKIFSGDLDISRRFPQKTVAFKVIDGKYREFINSMIQDPKVLSVLSRRHGQLGWRELQGENLRKHLIWCSNSAETLLYGVSSLLENFRSKFARLYFLSDEDCVGLLGISRQPRALLPFLPKCFSGAQSLLFSLPGIHGDVSSTNATALDLELHSHKLQVTHLVGNLKEVMKIDTIPAQSDAVTWFTMLERNIKQALMQQLRESIETRISKDCAPIPTVFEEVVESEILNKQSQPTEYRHWMLKYTGQVVLLSSAILWYRDLAKLLKNNMPKESFETFKKETIHKFNQLSRVIQENGRQVRKSPLRLRLQTILSALVTQTTYQRDILKSFEANQVKSINAYEWTRLIKHRADVIDYTSTDFKKEKVMTGQPSSMLSKAATAGDCYVEMLGDRDMYGYEYRALSSASDNISGTCIGTVITPVTERCMLSLNLAIKSHKCGGMFGENGVGKSVVLSELAAAYGRQFININCSGLFEIDIFKRLLCGMVESGCWLCFDHAQRLPATTLSILSQHITHIQEAYVTIKQATDTPYTVHGSDGKTRLKRSKSVTTLHDSLEDGTLASWKPQISESFFRLIKKTRFEESDANEYFAERNESHTFGSIVFENKLLRVKPGYAVFMNFTTPAGAFPELPDSMRAIYRPTCLIKPDTQKLIEVWLQAAGFADSVTLSHKLHLMYQLLEANADHISCTEKHMEVDPSASKVASIDLPTMKSIISVASLINCHMKTQQRSRSDSGSESDALGAMRTPSATSSSTSIGRSSRRSEMVLSNHNEELAIINAIFIIFNPKLGSAYSVSKFKENLRNIFPLSSRPAAEQKDWKLAAEVKQQMITDGLQPTEEWINKICELHTVVQLNQCVVVAGAAGSGKTTMYRILSKALNVLSNNQLDSDNVLPDGTKERANTANTATSQGTLLDKRDGVYSSASAVSFTDDFYTQGDQLKLQNLLNLEEIYSRVVVTVLFPNAYDISDLFGYFDTNVNVWKQGLIVKLLKECTIIHKQTKKKANEKSNVVQPSAGMQARDDQKKMKCPKLQKWIIFDGAISANWTDSLNCLLDGHHSVHMSNMDNVTLPKTTSVLFECADIASASPATISRCAIVHCNMRENWRSLASSWLESAYGLYAVTKHTIKVWRELLDDLVPNTLKYLAQQNGSVLTAGLDNAQQSNHSRTPGIHEVTSFLSILSSCLDAHSMRRYLFEQNNENDDVTINRSGKSNSDESKDDTQSSATRQSSVRSRLDEVVPDSHHQMSINFFGFAFVWAFGGHLLEDSMAMFDQYIRDALGKSRHDIDFPPYETVFDYFVDDEFGRFTLWEDKIDLRSRVMLPNGTSYIPVHQMERYAYFSSLLLRSQKSILLVGEPGCGKSSLVKSLMTPDLEMIQISMSRGLTAAHFQRLIETKASPSLKQHNFGLMAHPSAIMAARTVEQRHSIFFIDDVSCTASLKSELAQQPPVQPTLELLRQVLSLKGVYEHERLLFKSLDRDIAFIATCQTPGVPGTGSGQARHALQPSLARNFVVLHFLKPSKETILSIYHDAVQSWLEEFPAYSLVRHYDLSQAIIAGAYDLYSTIHAHLKPSPWQPHYIFSLHDISHIMQGLFLLAPRARGRPIPLRRRGGANQMKRPGAGKQLGRIRANAAGWGEGGSTNSGVPVMMRTIVRLWLHECSRVFFDRLVDDHDRNWMTHSLFETMKKHFCTGKDERPSSPTVEKVRIIKTPVPSAGSSQTYSSEGSSSGYIQSSMEGESENIRLDSDVVSSEQDPSIIDDDERNSVSSSSNRIPLDVLDNDNQNVYGTSEVSDSTIQVASTIGGSAVRSQTSASTAIHIQMPSTCPSADEDTSGTSPTQALYRETVISDDYTSHANTVVTEDDDTRSAVTGYTTELESVFESGTTSTQPSTSGTTSSSATSKTGQEPVHTARFADTAIHPSSGSKDHRKKMDKSDASPQLGKPSRPGGAKLGVTFMPGLIDDAAVAADLSGPLISLGQVLQPNEEATSVLFSKCILTSALGQGATLEGYVESTEAQLSEALSMCLNVYNKVSEKPMDLVFFTQSVRHAARLSRSMSLKRNGHALLLSTSRFSGRKSLTRIVAHLTGSKIFSTENFNPSPKELNQRGMLRKLIKDASFDAGVRDRPVILVLDEPYSTHHESLDDICALVQSGQCPALYSPNELAKIAAEFTQGSSNIVAVSSDSSSTGRKTALEKLDQNLETYFSRVLSNLHVVILASFPKIDGLHDAQSVETSRSMFGNNKKLLSFHQLLKRCPDILHHFSSVDLYREWKHQSWQTIAHHFLKNKTYGHETETNLMPWSSMSSIDNQLTNLSHLMAFVHKDSLYRAKASLLRGAEDIINPTTFQQMLNVFIGVARRIQVAEMKIIKRFERALMKGQEAEDSLLHSKESREQLLPKLDVAREHERSWKKHVEDERQEYTEARQRCSIEEDNIEMLEIELEQLRNDSKTTFDQVNPMQQSAMEIISSLNESSFDEIRRYTKPPESAVVVVTCLCHLFSVEPANWENGKTLINRDKFFKELEFYDKDHIPENIFQKMRSYVRSPEFKPDYIAQGSKAAESLCRWIHAIYYYSKSLRALAPKLAAQRQAEAKLFSAQATLGSKRVRCNQIKQELDSKIQMHKNASQAVKQHERELKNLDNQIEKAEILMANLQEHVDMWKGERDCALSRLESAIGDASLVAGCVAYHGVLGTEQRGYTVIEWINAYRRGYIDPESGSLEVPSKDVEPSDNETSLEHSSVGSKSEEDSLWSDEFGSSDNYSRTSTKAALLKIRDNFSLVDILSTPGEQRSWHRCGVPRDARARSDILRIHALTLHQQTSCCLFFDPDQQAEARLNCIIGRLRSDMERLEQEVVKPMLSSYSEPTPSVVESRPPTSAASLAESLGILDDVVGSSSSNHSDTESAAETEITTSASMAAESQPDTSDSRPSTTASKSRLVRFADEKSATNDNTSEDKSESNSEIIFTEEIDQKTENILVEPSPPLFSLDKLWVCRATDHNLLKILKNAMQCGAHLLITDIEQQALPARALNLHRSNAADPNFRLYLSMSVSIQHGLESSPGINLLPLSSHAVTDLSLSSEGLEERLEQMVLAQERPEFEAQRRLMEADIFHLEELTEQLHDNLLAKIADIEGPVLHEPSVLKAIQTCKKDAATTANSLQETKVMEQNLLQKKLELSEVSQHGRMLYNALEKVLVLQGELYRFSAARFLRFYGSCLRARMRGKASGGATSGGTAGVLLKSRVVELKQSLTEDILKIIEKEMFVKDAQTFCTLISMEHMISDNKMSRDEMIDLVGATSLVEEKEIDEDKDLMHLHKPTWLNFSTWDDVLTLEKTYPAYNGLAESMSTKPKRWNEYLTSPPVLLSRVPCNKLHDLSLGQKALLWKTLAPDVLSKVISDLNTSVLGGVTAKPNIFYLQNIFPTLSHNKPCVFVLPPPPQETCFIPSIEIKELAQSKGITFLQRSASFGDGLGNLLETCMIHGQWLLLENCHLEQEWSTKFLKLLSAISELEAYSDAEYRMGHAQHTVVRHDEVKMRSVATLTDSGNRTTMKNVDVKEEIVQKSDILCHNRFRLWMVYRDFGDSSRTFPGVLLNCAQIVTLETPTENRDLVRKMHQNVISTIDGTLPPKQASVQNVGPSYLNRITLPYNVTAAMKIEPSEIQGKKPMMVQLSLLHSILLQRALYSKPGSIQLWKDGELESAARILLIEDAKAARNLCNWVMRRNVAEQRELDVVQTIATGYLGCPSSTMKHRNLMAILDRLLRQKNNPEQLFEMLLQKPNFKDLGLHPASEMMSTISNSRRLRKDIEYVISTEIIRKGRHEQQSNPLLALPHTVHVRRTLDNYLSQIRESHAPDVNVSILSVPLMDFFNGEIQRIQSIISIIECDLDLCSSMLEGEIEPSTQLLALAEDVALDRFPEPWLQHHPHLFRFHSAQKLSLFIKHIDRRCVLLEKYMTNAASSNTNVKVPGPSTGLQPQEESTSSRCSSATQTLFAYNLATFTRPDLFLQSLLFSIARSKFHDAHKYTFSKEFIISTKLLKPEECKLQASGDFETVFIDGLYLHKAMYNKKTGFLQETKVLSMYKMPLLKLTAEKKSIYRRSKAAFEDSDRDIYSCPVWLNEDSNAGMCKMKDVITFVPIPTELDSEQCLTSGVSLCCYLNHD